MAAKPFMPHLPLDSEVSSANSSTVFPISRAADRILGCSVRLRYTLGSALTNSPSDTYFALPVHLPLYHRQLLFLKNSPWVFQALGHYLISVGEMIGGSSLSTYEETPDFHLLSNKNGSVIIGCLSDGGAPVSCFRKAQVALLSLNSSLWYNIFIQFWELVCEYIMKPSEFQNIDRTTLIN